MRHELHLLRAATPAIALAVALVTTAGVVVSGVPGAVSAAIGAGIVVVNQLAAVMSTAWARTLSPTVVAVGYAGFVARMMAVVAALAIAAAFPAVHRGHLVVGFCVTLVASLAAECVSYARGSYVPDWRVRT